MVLGICGAGGLGKEVLQLAKEVSKFYEDIEHIVFIDDYIDTKIVSNIEVYRFVDIVKIYSNKQIEFVIALGEPEKRVNEYNRIANSGYNLHTLIHPNVIVPNDVVVGKGVIINGNTHISCGDVIDDNVLIQPMACIGHDNRIGCHSVISSQTSLGGNVTIGNASFVAMGVPIKQGVIVGNNVIVGLGSIVRNNIESDVVTFGNPLRIIKNNGRWKVFS